MPLLQVVRFASEDSGLLSLDHHSPSFWVLGSRFLVDCGVLVRSLQLSTDTPVVEHSEDPELDCALDQQLVVDNRLASPHILGTAWQEGYKDTGREDR